MIKEEIQKNSERLEYVDKAADYLLKKCDAHDSVVIQRQVDDFRKTLDNIIERINKYQNKLTRIAAGEVSKLRNIACSHII